MFFYVFFCYYVFFPPFIENIKCAVGNGSDLASEPKYYIGHQWRSKLHRTKLFICKNV